MEKLDFLSSDPHTIQLYKAREYAEHEKANLFSSGKEEGIKEGIKEGKKEVARALLDVLDDETIALKTGLTITEVKNLRQKI
nr:hypothetical protein [uncultured Niameybacter sp.]